VTDAGATFAASSAPLRLRLVRRLIEPAERLYATVALSVVAGAYLPLIGRVAQPGEESGAESPLAHIVLLPLYAIMCALILRRPRGFLRVAVLGAPAWALVGLAILSASWSLEPGLTLRRGIALLAPTALGVLLAQRFTREELLRVLGWALGIAAVTSTVVSLALPEYGVSAVDYGSAWQGVFLNKNGLGRAMAFAATVLVLVAMQSSRRRWLPWCGAVLALALVALSRSATSLVAVTGMLLLIPLFRSLRLRSAIVSGVWLIAVLAGSFLLTLVMAHNEALFAALGRDPTLTGRTTMWAVVLTHIAEQPWLGHGYNAFWLGWSGPSAALLSEVGWDTPHAHNGFLDLGLDLGVVGLSILGVGLVVTTRAALRSARSSTLATGVWPLAFLCYLLLINVTETSLLRQHNLYWILYVAVMCDVLGESRRGWSQSPPARAPSSRLGASLGVRRAVRARRTDA
jgi:O-antigen ligase